MAAAVSDYRAAQLSGSKIKRTGADLSLELVENPDLLATFAAHHRDQAEGKQSRSHRGVIVGFAAESSVDVGQASEKLSRKGVDYLFVNDIAHQEVFNSPSNGGFLIDKYGTTTIFEYQSKDTLSDALLDVVAKALS